jgi:hypothetical protein
MLASFMPQVVALLLPELPRWAEAAVKAVSLGYLLGVAGLAVCAAVWFRLRHRIAPAERADLSFMVLASAAALQLLLGIGIWYGVITHRILMTTHYFHHLMHGGWSIAITTAGLTLLAVSLLIAAWSALRAQPLRLPAAQSGDLTQLSQWQAEAALIGLTLDANSGVATASLVGIRQPHLSVNPVYWQSLSAGDRQLALQHECQHLRRRDNLRKLVLDGIAMAFAVLPDIRAWAKSYELDCEVAVDATCRNEPGYRKLIADASLWMLRPLGASATSLRATPELNSGLSQADLARRLELLAAEPVTDPSSGAHWLVALCIIASTVPAMLLLSHPLTRCLLACYLGY